MEKRTSKAMAAPSWCLVLMSQSTIGAKGSAHHYWRGICSEQQVAQLQMKDRKAGICIPQARFTTT